MEGEIWTQFRIYQDGEAITVEYGSNDDDDDGYPDPEVVRATYRPKSLKAALDITGKSRRGVYGHKVDVHLNGEKI